MTSARTRWIAAPSLALAAFALAGCSAVNPITTNVPYSASDGIRVELGDALSAENLLVISDAKGEPGALIGGLTNGGTADARVTIAAEGSNTVTVHVPAGVTVLLGTEADAALSLDSVDVPPGAVLPVTISTPAGGSQSVSIPVLDGSFPEYATLVPTPTPTATATATPKPTATATPKPTPSPSSSK